MRQYYGTVVSTVILIYNNEEDIGEDRMMNYMK
jgi:hypothetical protein